MDSYLVVESAPAVTIFRAKVYGLGFKTLREAHEFALGHPKPAQIIARDNATGRRRWLTHNEQHQLRMEIVR